MLAIPTTEGKFVLDTDASNLAIGWKLRQNQDGQEMTIVYASRELSTDQRCYCMTQKELFAVVKFICQFCHYLLGPKFMV